MEITLKLTFKKNADGSLTIRYGIPLWYRILSFAILAIIVSSIILVQGTNALGFIILALSLLAALYEETWFFDESTKTVRSKTGLLFLAKRNAFPFADVSQIELNDFARGKVDQGEAPVLAKMPYGSQTRLIITLKNEDRFLINAVSFRKRLNLEKDSQEIARLIGVPLL